MNLSYDVNLRQHGPLRKLHQRVFNEFNPPLNFILLQSGLHDRSSCDISPAHCNEQKKKAGLSIKK